VPAHDTYLARAASISVTKLDAITIAPKATFFKDHSTNGRLALHFLTKNLSIDSQFFVSLRATVPLFLIHRHRIIPTAFPSATTKPAPLRFIKLNPTAKHWAANNATKFFKIARAGQFLAITKILLRP